MNDLKLKKAIFIRLETPEDLARLAATSVPMGQTAHILRYKIDNSRYALGVIGIMRDYYEYRGIPAFYYVICEEKDACSKAKYISFRITEEGEQVLFVNRNIPGSSLIPIMNLKKPPELISLDGVGDIE